MDKIISINDLSHRYTVQWAVKGVSFEVTQYGIYGLLGSNGAGKSTIMNILCGILKQTSGTISVNGIDLLKDPEGAKRQIGFLPQKPPVYGEFTVEEYLRYCAKLRYVPSAEIPHAVESVMKRCNITHYRRRLISNLSGGYQQRVGIAQAIVHNPSVIILDEPTNGLDPNQILDIRHLIKDIAEDKTVFVSTHILSEVQAMCDYIYMIERGELVFMGSVDEFDNYILPSSLVVTLDNAPSVERLKEIPNLLSLEVIGSKQYRMHFADLQQAIEQLVETSVNENWLLAEIYPEKSSLDEIFAELSKK